MLGFKTEDNLRHITTQQRSIYVIVVYTWPLTVRNTVCLYINYTYMPALLSIYKRHGLNKVNANLMVWPRMRHQTLCIV